MTDSERILVMGVGNPLMRDEGVGPRVAELLMAGYNFPPNVEVVDAGTMSYMILDLLRGMDRLLLIDAVRDTGEPAGTVMLLTPEDMAPNQVMHSLHDIRVVDVLQAADLMGNAPQTQAICVQIESIEEFVVNLSEPVERALPVAVGAALQVLAEMGVHPTPREDSNVHADIIGAMRSYKSMPEESKRPVGE